MPTVPQPYEYLIANIPGGIFEGSHSDRLLHLIQTQIPAGVNPVISSDSTNITVSFDFDLEDTDKAILDDLVERSADYFIVSTDGGSNDLGDPALIEEESGLESASTITLQIKDGDGINVNGFEELITIHAPLMTISTLSGQFDVTGEFEFTVGAELNRGEAEVIIEAAGLPSRTVIARWT